MGQYNKAVLTLAGENLIARTLAGEIQLIITKAKTSNYIYPAGTDFKSLTDMQGIKQTATDPTTAVYDNTMIQTRALFSNEEILSTYYIQNIGLYAMDGTEEVLFCIVTAETPDEMPQYNGVASTSYIYNIQNVVQDAAELNISVNPSGTATIQDVMERVDATGGDISETVIETLDTVEDKYPVPAAGESVKRFFGKVLTFLKNIKPLTGDIILYVETTGSDIAGDGSQGNPFRTIQFAIDSLPKDLGGYTATIQVSDGVYDESVIIRGFKTGSFVLVSTHPDTMSSAVKITHIECTHNNAYITIHSVEITGTANDGIVCSSCSNMFIYCVRCIGIANTLSAIYVREVNLFRINTCELSNKKYAAYVNNSRGYILGSTGVGNEFSMLSTGASHIHRSDTIPAGNLRTAAGGVISNENGTQLSWSNVQLGCTWGTTYGSYYRYGNKGGEAMIVVQLRVTSTTALSAGVAYYVTGLPQPTLQGLTSVAVATSQPSETKSAVLDTLGRLTFAPQNNQPIGYTLTFNCTYITSNS